ncbi:MAG: Domain containing protein [Labilithrix sp.]|nr:Domain containing protein [Labilithrix sp.]
MKRNVVLELVMASCLAVACGGSPKTVESPDPSLAAPPAAGSAAPAGRPGEPAASTNDDLTRGTGAVKAGDWTTARAAFESAIAKNPKQAEAYYYLGLVMDKTGDKPAAEKNYQKALELQPDLQEAAENLTAIYVETQKFDDAIALARKALARNAKNAEMQLNLAVALSGKGDVDGANKAFDDAVKLAPNDARFYVAYADHLTAAKRNEEAVAKLKQAQRVAGEDAAMLGTIGFGFRTARAVPECIAVFDKAIGLKDNADFRTNRALCKLAGKDKSGATADLTAATQKEPGFAPAHYWLGSLQHEDGKFTEAAAEYDAYLKAAPKGPMAKAAEAKLKLARDKKKPPERKK